MLWDKGVELSKLGQSLLCKECHKSGILASWHAFCWKSSRMLQSLMGQQNTSCAPHSNHQLYQAHIICDLIQVLKLESDPISCGEHFLITSDPLLHIQVLAKRLLWIVHAPWWVGLKCAHSSSSSGKVSIRSQSPFASVMYCYSDSDVMGHVKKYCSVIRPHLYGVAKHVFLAEVCEAWETGDNHAWICIRMLNSSAYFQN